MFWERINVFLDNTISKRVLQSINNIYDHSSSEVAYGMALQELKGLIQSDKLLSKEKLEAKELSHVLKNLLSQKDPALMNVRDTQKDNDLHDMFKAEMVSQFAGQLPGKKQRGRPPREPKQKPESPF